MSKEISNDIQDALNSMNEELTQPNGNNQSSTSNTDLQSSNSHEIIEVAQSHTSVPIKKQLKIFEEINIQMGRFCQALKVVDAQFEQQAQVFYKAADELGKKEKLSDEESIEFAVNIAAWATVKVFGKIYANLQKSKQLTDVKRILKQEAEAHFDAVKRLKEWMPAILDTAYDRYNQVSDFEGITRCVSNLRESEYMNAVILFLEATYEAALQNKFQDVYAYPSFAPINRHILYGLLCGKPEFACDDFLEGRRNCIFELISHTEDEINGNTEPSKESYVFASDSQVMAIAIHDINPLTDSNQLIMDEESEEDRLLSQNYYDRLVKLYEMADLHPNNVIAQAVLNNESLVETVVRYQSIAKTFKEYNSLYTYQLSIIGLSGILVFLSTWLTLGWLTWYWDLLVGVIVGALVYWMMPTKKGIVKVYDKLIRIEKSIQSSNRSKGGDVKMVDLAYMDSQTKSPWAGAIIGAICGLPFIAVGGPLWGAGIGFLAVLFFGGGDGEEDSDYSYDHIKVAPSWFIKILTYILIAGCIYTVVNYFVNNKNNRHSFNKENVVNSNIEKTVEIEDSVEIAAEPEDAQEEAAHQAIVVLYRIFYGNDNEYCTYSQSIKDKFKELDVVSSIEDVYTPSFQSEIKRMDEMQQKVGDLSVGFDSDILFYGQGDRDNINLVVTSIKTIDDDNIIIEAKYHNTEDYDRTFKMKRIDGTFKIDDMDGIRKYIDEQCKLGEQLLKEMENSSNEDTEIEVVQE